MKKIGAFLFPFAASVLLAAVPNRIIYQGRLTKSGVTVAGSHDFKACLRSGGGNICCRDYTQTLPMSGDFTLTIDPDAAPACPAVDWLNDAVQLQLTVDSHVMSPDDDFTSVPYALVAATAASVRAGDVHLMNAAQSLSSWQSASSPALIDAGKIDGSLPGQWSRESDGRLHYEGGNVGIGTSAPADKLSVGGNLYFTGNLESDGGFVIRDRTAGADRITVSNGGPVTIHNGLSMNGTKISGLAAAANPDEAVRYDQLAGVLPAGLIFPYGGAGAPAGYLPCNGSPVSRATYAALFAAIGTNWGPGDGATTFNLPDLRGRAPIGAGQGTGLTNRDLGDYLGEETHKLTVGEMPSHNHNLFTLPGDNNEPGGFSGGGWAGDPQHLNTSTEGGDKPHNNMQPSAAVNYIIKY